MSIIENPGAVVKRARPRRYTLGELYRMFKDAALTRFFGQMVLCREPRLCAFSLILGLVVLDFLTRHSLPQLVGMVCSMVLFHGLLYSVLRRYVLLPVCIWARQSDSRTEGRRESQDPGGLSEIDSYSWGAHTREQSENS